MTKYHIHIEAGSDSELKTHLRNLAWILTGLRQTTKRWREHYGYNNKKDMELWEQRADQWIDKYKILVDDSFINTLSTNGGGKENK